MASTIFDTVVEQVKTLSTEQQRQLRLLLDTWLASSNVPPTEDEFEQALVTCGLLSVPNWQGFDVEHYQRYIPVAVRGKPVSETLIEDRR